MIDWDLRKFRILRELQRQGTVTAAAQALSLTPSAVSQSLSALAKQVGTPIVEPEGRRVRLTEAARLLLRHGEEVFAQLERAEAELSAYTAGDLGVVRIGSFATGVPALVMPAVAELRVAHPALEIRVHEAEASELFDLLEHGEIDVALSLAPQAPAGADRRFARFALLAEPLDLALPADHPRARQRTLRLAELADEPWIFGGSGPWHDITLAVCAAAGFTPRAAHTASDWTAILSLVNAGMGIALVPRLVTTTLPNLTLRTLPTDRPHRHILAAARRGSEHAPRLREVLRALHHAAKSASASQRP